MEPTQSFSVFIFSPVIFFAVILSAITSLMVATPFWNAMPSEASALLTMRAKCESVDSLVSAEVSGGAPRENPRFTKTRIAVVEVLVGSE